MKNYSMLPIKRKSDIPLEYRDTPLGLLLEYHNLKRPYEAHAQARLLIGMCMDNRKHLHIPDNFSYIIRSGGGNLRFSEFKVSYAIAIGRVQHIALIGHNHCGMVNIASKKDTFINGLVKRAGWSRAAAEDHFMNLALMHDIGNEIEFVLSEAQRLKMKYPKIMIAPFYYKLEDNRLYCLMHKQK